MRLRRQRDEELAAAGIGPVEGHADGAAQVRPLVQLVANREPRPAFPVAGYIGWKIGGRVDAVDSALVGGALTGAGLAAVQWWAAKGALGRPAAWIGAGAISYAVGLAAGSALAGYDTDLGALAVMGFVSGAALGTAQGLVLARQGRRSLALAWALAMPVLFALGWSAASVTGIGVDDQFTVFGAGGALLFTLLSGVLLARLTSAGARAA